MELVSSLTYSGPEPGSPEQVQAIIEELHRLYPGAKCTLNFSTPLELLVATQLAAQCTDERVNMVTAQLFRKYRSEEDWFDLSHLMIYHGRAICDARKPLCGQCSLSELCPSAIR